MEYDCSYKNSTIFHILRVFRQSGNGYKFGITIPNITWAIWFFEVVEAWVGLNIFNQWLDES